MAVGDLWDVFLDAALPHADLILPAFFVCFVIGTVAAFVLGDRAYVKRSYLTGFFSVLVVVSLIGVLLFPIIDMHKFPSPTGEEHESEQLRIVDEDGNELIYDTRATDTNMGSGGSLASSMADGYDDQERLEMAQFLIEEAEEYRNEVEANETDRREYLQPPRYVDSHKWTADAVADTSSFEVIRVYRETLTFTDDDTDAESSHELLVEINVETGEVTEFE